MVMVPALSYVLRYRKGRSAANDSVWSLIGSIPVRAPSAIIVVTLLFSAYGAMILSDELGKDITGSSDEVPPGLQSYEALAEYSRVFNGGQTNMFIVDAEDRGRVNTAPIRDLPILDAIDRIQTQDIDTVDNTTSISLVTILKSIPVTIQDPITETVIFDDTLWGLLHSDCWDNPTSGIECPFLLLTDRETMVNVVFDTLFLRFVQCYERRSVEPIPCLESLYESGDAENFANHRSAINRLRVKRIGTKLQCCEYRSCENTLLTVHHLFG